MSVVSVVGCDAYELDAIRQAITAVLAPLGGMGRFVRPGMRVLLKPNLLTAANPERAVTTHPAVIQAVAEIVQQAGGEVWIGDSPAGSAGKEPQVWRKSGTAEIVARTGVRLLSFDGATWRRLNGQDYFIARPIFEADLVINLPKLKTHSFTLYTGAVKNLFGAIPGIRKRQVHYQMPWIEDFSRVLVDVLELVRPGLTILDGVIGLEGNGPGVGGTPRHYKCLAASADPVALDSVVTRAMGYRAAQVLHLAEAGVRGLGAADLRAIKVEGERQVLDFGSVHLPTPRWYFRVPTFILGPMRRAARTRPRLDASVCTGCGRCVEACPCEVIAPGNPLRFDLENCMGCLCCCEVCPQGAIGLQRNLLAQLVDWGLSSFGL